MSVLERTKSVEQELWRAKNNIYDRFPELKDVLAREAFPGHLSLTPDGNRRYAKRFFSGDSTKGHRIGAERVVSILRDLSELPIQYITAWGFSTENWGRPPEEIDGIMDVLDKTVQLLLPEIQEKNAKFMHIGRLDRIEQKFPTLAKSIMSAQEDTRKNIGQRVILAVDFSGKDQDMRAMTDMTRAFIVDYLASAAGGESKELPERKEIELAYSRFLDGDEVIPPVDLAIRTGGSTGSSGFGIDNYAERYTINQGLPGVTTRDIVKAISWYSKLERRKGR